MTWKKVATLSAKTTPRGRRAGEDQKWNWGTIGYVLQNSDDGREMQVLHSYVNLAAFQVPDGQDGIVIWRFDFDEQPRAASSDDIPF
jgi:hypothetical protein